MCPWRELMGTHLISGICTLNLGAINTFVSFVHWKVLAETNTSLNVILLWPLSWQYMTYYIISFSIDNMMETWPRTLKTILTFKSVKQWWDYLGVEISTFIIWRLQHKSVISLNCITDIAWLGTIFPACGSAKSVHQNTLGIIQRDMVTARNDHPIKHQNEIGCFSSIITNEIKQICFTEPLGRVPLLCV